MTKAPKDQLVIQFDDGKFAPAMCVEPEMDPSHIIQAFNLITPRPIIFISGGAGAMSEEDIARTRDLLENGIAAYAQEKRITLIDGGTEAGVMEMIGTARRKHNYNFPLIGVAPLAKIEYPGYDNHQAEAALQQGHSHFVLVNTDNWGGESETIIALSKAIAAGQAPMVGILINGGKIAEHEVYLAAAQGETRMPVIIIDGSGRTADNISTAFKTQSTNSAVIRAIIQGADLRLTALADGVEALLHELDKVFK